MTGDSFSFGKYNSLDDWGIKVIGYDVLVPQKRSRKLQIPGRSGMFDFGAKNWNERSVRIECVLTQKMSKADFREIAYALSRKAQLRLWNEPDKYYIAELYEAPEVQDYYLETAREFELVFTCEPFAYGKSVTAPIATGRNAFTYSGTAETPCVIVLRNNSTSSIENVTITAIKRKE